MSYIEKKYRDKIKEIFTQLPELDEKLLELLNYKSIKKVDEIAVLYAEFNKKINLILKQYYPEIKDINDKLEFKTILHFYYDLFDKLTDLIMNIENYQKIDDKYFQSLIDFIEDKENLISGKYKEFSTRELTAFYDPVVRENLETIMEYKIKQKARQFFTLGPLEEEIKKIARIGGADDVSINSIDSVDESLLFLTASSVIKFSLSSEDEKKLSEIGEELKTYLESKEYKVNLLLGVLITDAKLLPDELNS